MQSLTIDFNCYDYSLAGPKNKNCQEIISINCRCYSSTIICFVCLAGGAYSKKKRPTQNHGFLRSHGILFYLITVKITETDLKELEGLEGFHSKIHRGLFQL